MLGVIIVLLIGAVGFVLWQQYITKNVEPQNTQLPQVGGKIESPQVSQPAPTPQAITPTPQKDETVGWKTYRNDKYGFEFKYWPGFKQKSEDQKSVDFEQCKGAVKQYPGGTGPEGLAEVCQGTARRLFAEVREQKSDPAHLADESEMQKPVKKVSINGHDFYIARHEVYTYVGWDAQTSLNGNTLIFGFSGNGFVLQPTSTLSSKELEQIRQILETVQF